jgi:hypothetical protein
MVYTVADMLDSRHAPGAKEFRIISSSVLPSTTSSNSSVAAFSPPTCVHTQTQRQLQALAAKSASSKRVPSNSKDGLSEGSRHQIYGASQVAKHQHTSRTGTADERLSQSSPRSSTEADRKAALKSALQQIAPALPLRVGAHYHNLPQQCQHRNRSTIPQCGIIFSKAFIRQRSKISTRSHTTTVSRWK